MYEKNEYEFKIEDEKGERKLCEGSSSVSYELSSSTNHHASHEKQAYNLLAK